MAKTLQMEQLVEPKLLIIEPKRVVRYFKVLYDYGQNNKLTGKGKTINGKCNHKRMCFKYVEEIETKRTHRI